MYENLVQRLREEAIQWCAICVYKNEESYICHAPEEPSCDIRDRLQAADAIEERDRYALTLQHEMMAEAESHIALVERLNKRIEELELHYCPHAIRNVHDRGDDSICRVLGTEPPEEEA